MSPREVLAAVRPRVAGDREQEILDAALTVLAEVGYDRLTMDAVATRAKASKATLYRRWDGKPALVIDALISQKTPLETTADTGSLRSDLLTTFCAAGGLTDSQQTALLGSVVTAISCDPEFAAAWRARFIAPKLALTREIFERAQARGELRDGLDLELVAAALPGIVLHQIFLVGAESTPDLVAHVVDQVILPAVLRG